MKYTVPLGLRLQQLLACAEGDRLAARVALILGIKRLEEDLADVRGLGGFAVEGNTVHNRYISGRVSISTSGGETTSGNEVLHTWEVLGEELAEERDFVGVRRHIPVVHAVLRVK